MVGRFGAWVVAPGRSIWTALRRSGFALGLTWTAARWSVVATLVLVVAGGAAPTLTAWIQRSIIDGLVDRQASESDLLWWALALGGAGLLGAMIPHVRRPIDGMLRRRVDLVSDDRLYTAVNAFPGLARFEDPRFLDRLRLGQQAGKTGPNGFLSALFSAIQAAVSAVGFIVSLMIINPTLVVAVLATALPAVGAQFALSNRRVTVERRNSPLLRRQVFYSNLLTGIEAVKEIRLFGLGRFFRGRMQEDLRAIHRGERALELRTLWTQGGLGLLTAVTTAAALVWVVREAYLGRLTVGDIALFIAALAGLQNALSSLIGRLADMHQALALLGNFIQVLEDGPDLPIADPPAPLAPLGRGIELRDVWFRYGPDRPWVLKGVTVSIPHGSSVAVAGLNGAGKSTLVKLLCRFYDPVVGTISWDGVDIRRSTRPSCASGSVWSFRTTCATT